MTEYIHVFYAAAAWTAGFGLILLIGGWKLADWATKPIPEDHPTKD